MQGTLTMTSNRVGLLIVLGLFAWLVSGCGGNTLLPDGNTTAGTDETSPSAADTAEPAAADTAAASLELLSLTADTSVAQGQPFQISWRVTNLPSGATMSLYYRPAGRTEETAIATGVATAALGSFTFDTSPLPRDRSYQLVARLMAGGSQAASAVSTGNLNVQNPRLSVVSPTSADVVLLPSESEQVSWQGAYLPVGGTIELFLDVDQDFTSGNEVIITSSLITTSGAQLAGNITLDAEALWDNASVTRGLFYYVGIRSLKNAQLAVAAYAPAAIRLYDGTGFAAAEPTKDKTITVGDPLIVTWESFGVPVGLRVGVVFTDPAGNAVTAAEDYAVQDSIGQVDTTGLLSAGTTYTVDLKLMDGDKLIATKRADGKVTTNP